MAIVTAPFLSLGASGQIAKTLVATRWKGLKVLRQFVIPANPRSPDQVIQRNFFTDSVKAWRNFLQDADIRAAWNRFATVSGIPQSGFNAAMSSLIQEFPLDPDVSYASQILPASSQAATAIMKNMDDGGTGDEAGDFDILVGDAPASLLLFQTKAIASGSINIDPLGSAGDIKFIDIQKDGFSRSGIFKLTLI